MSKVAAGNTIKINYTGRFPEGEVFDTSEGREPLEFKVGEGALIVGMENAVLDMEVGEKKTVEVPVAEAYGEHMEQLVQVVNIDEMPENVTPEVGMVLQGQQPNGQPFMVTITNVTEEEVTLDANHPMAGKDLVFDIEVVEIAE